MSLIKERILVIFLLLYIVTLTTEIYTLSLHDALPICVELAHRRLVAHLRPDLLARVGGQRRHRHVPVAGDRKSTRLNSSHSSSSYAVFCLKKKKVYS